MKRNLLPQDSETLFAFAEEMAKVLGENQAARGITKDEEALLRASIAAATFARSAYLAILADAGESPFAHGFLAQASMARERTEQRLRERLGRLIPQIRKFYDDDLLDVAGYVLSVSG